MIYNFEYIKYQAVKEDVGKEFNKESSVKIKEADAKEKESEKDKMKEVGVNNSEKSKGKRKIDETEKVEVDGNDINKKRRVYPILRSTATVKPLFEAMHGLSKERKKVIRKMGFGDLIDFPINEVPTKLAFYVVDSLDVEGMNLRLPTGNLQVSPQTVKMVFGLPRGSRRLEGEREKNELFEQEWKDQFKDEKKLTTYAISKQISKTTNIDFIFRMNFLMLVANTLGECDNNYVVKTTVLESIHEEDDVSEIDWCSFVYECAKLSKKDWASRKRDRTEVVYYGPTTFLMVSQY